MLYAEYVRRIKDVAILLDEDTGIYYLDPDWKFNIYVNDLPEPNEVKSEYALTWEDVKDILNLEVIKRNKINDNKKAVIDWVYNLITSTVEPAVLQEETEYVAQMMDYLKFRNEHPELPINQGENDDIGDEKVKQLLKSGMSFAKK